MTEEKAVNEAASSIVGKTVEAAPSYSSADSPTISSNDDDDDDDSLSYFAKLAQS
jgi:hypothetical protein